MEMRMKENLLDEAGGHRTQPAGGVDASSPALR
jgi:hypothetical protein